MTKVLRVTHYGPMHGRCYVKDKRKQTFWLAMAEVNHYEVVGGKHYGIKAEWVNVR